MIRRFNSIAKRILPILLFTCLLLSVQSSSAWNPYVLGASAASWKPTDIPGCILWLKSDIGVTKGEDPYPVSAWADQSGQGNNLTQGTAANQPLWVANQLNGHPSIRFDGTNDSLQDNFTLAHPIDAYLVVRQITWVFARIIFDGYSSATAPVIQYNTTPKVGIYYGPGGGWGGLNPDLAVGSFGLLQVRYNGLTDSYLRVNGGTPTTHTCIQQTMNGITLGNSGSLGDFANVEYCEVIIYNVVLSDADRTLVQNYLNERYVIY